MPIPDQNCSPGKRCEMSRGSFVFVAVACVSYGYAQTTLSASSFDTIQPRMLGPTTMGGRIMDLAVYDKEPRIFYVATASGGLWKTENGGTTVSTVFDREKTVALGAVAVSQTDPNIVWVGTGEAGSRNSTSWGDGVYKSTDGGKTWTNMGLRDSRHISRIWINPKNPDHVFVGALGQLWGKNEERGLYESKDGGRSWNRLLYVDDATGVVDLAVNPKNNNEMLVAMYERMRWPYRFASGGKGSGLYRTTNGGKTFTKVTKGMPEGDTGRIGLSYFHSNPKIVIATIENRAGGTFRSTDGGQSWTNVNRLNPRPFYFSMPRQDPLDENRIYLGAVSIHVSTDQGKTFRTMNNRIHPDYHAFWINPTDSNHMIVGNDGGVAQTRDRGLTWQSINALPIGQYYGVAFDMRKPYYVYGGLQDNGSWGFPTQTSRGGVAFYDAYGIGGGDGFHVQVDPDDWRYVYSESQGGAVSRLNQQTGEQRSIRPRPPQGERYRFNWSSPIVISPHNNKTVFFGGNRLFKSVDRGNNWQVISPDLTTNDSSKLTPGAGVTPEDTGAERHCTIITISESPITPGIIWVGTDDGLVQLTTDGGNSWSNLTSNIPELPKNTWCSRVTASSFAQGRCYATFDGHRNNDYNAYCYVTEDFGKTWTRLAKDLPQDESCYVIKEGTQNPDLLVLGTELSLYFSLDRGQTWSRFRSNGFPTVSVHDVAIHPRELDLVVGTHGRSIWILPIAGLEQLTKENMEKEVFLCRPTNAYFLGFVTGRSWDGDGIYVSPNSQPNATINYYLKSEVKGDVTVVIQEPDGTQVTSIAGSKNAGLNSVRWNCRVRGRANPSGQYRVILTVDGKQYMTSLTIEDISMNMKGQD